MATICIVGVQWGDEGKGKIVDVLSQDADYVVRYQGGANAGHTVRVNGEKFVMHHIPSGILHPRVRCVISNGVVIDPSGLLSEIDALRGRGIKVDRNLLVSDRAHVVMPYHKTMDRLQEVDPNLKIGTTLRGIGPCYADKVARSGFRMADLYNSKTLEKRLSSILKSRNLFFGASDRLVPEQIESEYKDYARRLKPFISDTIEVLNEAVRKDKKLIFEGAHGTLLDIDFGTYPYVTSSNSDVCGLSAGTGLSPKSVNRVLGIAKAYTTRVGEGPFQTEIKGKIGELIREVGHEYGSTTGRSRRCGWFDGVSVKYACKINGADELVITKLDVLSGLSEIGFAVSYRVNGKLSRSIPADTSLLEGCKPLYKMFKGWPKETSTPRKMQDLHQNAKRYLDFIERYLDVPITIVSVGGDRKDLIWRK